MTRFIIFIFTVILYPAFNYVLQLIYYILNIVINLISMMGSLAYNYLHHFYIQSIGWRLNYSISLILPFSFSDYVVLYFIKIIQWLLIFILLKVIYNYLCEVYNIDNKILNIYNDYYNKLKTFYNLKSIVGYNFLNKSSSRSDHRLCHSILTIDSIIKQVDSIQFLLNNQHQLSGDELLKAIYNTLFGNKYFISFGKYKLINVIAYINGKPYHYFNSIINNDSNLEQFMTSLNNNITNQFINMIMKDYIANDFEVVMPQSDLLRDAELQITV
jgi:hypothetical protein